MISGFAGSGIHLEAGNIIDINHNLLYYNDSIEFTNHDIWVDHLNVSGEPYMTPDGVMIDHNFCYSNNNNGILLLGVPQATQITNNTVEPCDSDLGKITDPASINKKHAITVYYNISANAGIGEGIVAHNYCRGARFAAIYLNNNTSTDPQARLAGDCLG